MIRTTLTLEDDLARTLRDEARRTGRPFRDVLNATLRDGLNRARTASAGASRDTVRLPAFSLGMSPESAAISANKLNDLLETDHLASPRG